MRTFDQLSVQLENSSLSGREAGDGFLPESDSKPDHAPSGELRHQFVYDLQIEGQSSDQFYADVSFFSARVVAEIDRRAAGVLDAYSHYVTSVVREPPRSRGEYGLELLTVGMA